MATRHLSGKGELFWGNQRVASVTYALVDVLSTATSFGDSYGTLQLIEGETNLMRYNMLTLHLEDGQELDVIVASQPGFPKQGGAYRVEGTGPFRHP